MKHRMKRHTIYSILILCVTWLFASCENMRDDNGDLGGTWQLLEWRDSQGQLLASKEDLIFYSIRKELLRVRIHDGSDYYHTYFQHTKDSLVLYYPVSYMKDSVVPLSELQRYGVPADGRFHIDLLNNKHLMLSSDEGKLSFRKY